MPDPATDEAKPTAPPRTSELLPDDRMKRLKRWYKESIERVEKWRKQAEEDFAFVDGHQWDPKDEAKLKEENRPAIVFNRTGATIDAACGVEIGQQQEITCKQKGLEDGGTAEVATAIVEWVDDQCDATTEESDAFRDCLISGLAWVECRVDDVGEIRVVEQRIDPFEIVWDASSQRRNFTDGRHVFRTRELSLEEAREFFPGVEDEDLDCTWDTGDGKTIIEGRRGYGSGRHDDDLTGQRVKIGEAQWRELEIDPETGRKKWCIYQSFFGRVELQPPVKLPTGPEGLFNYQACTGKYDHKDKIPYGIVRSVKDPQRYANKFLLQSMHILNTTAKNAVGIEQGSVENLDQFRKEWAQPGAVVEFRPGALVNGRVQLFSGQQMPTVLADLMMFALSSIRECSGINLEMLGQAAREQAGVLEQERKKAAVTILAVYFKNLTALRKTLGKLRLRYALSGMIPPEDLMEAVGPDNAETLAQLTPDKALRYDIIVDESPTSPNAKDRYWNAMQPVLPALMKREDLPPEVWAEIVRYMPIPSGMSEALIRAFTKPPEPDPNAERMKEAQTAKVEGEARDKHASADLKLAQIGEAQAGASKEQAEAVRTLSEPFTADVTTGGSSGFGPSGAKESQQTTEPRIIAPSPMEQMGGAPPAGA